MPRPEPDASDTDALDPEDRAPEDHAPAVDAIEAQGGMVGVQGKTPLTAAQAEFDAASLAYLPPPAPLVAIIGGLLAAYLVGSFVYYLVATGLGYDIFAPGGPAFHAGNAVGQLSAGEGFSPVLGQNDMSVGLTTVLAIPTWLFLSIPIVVLGWLYGPGIARWIGLRMKPVDIAIGLPIGFALQLLVIPGLYWVVLKIFPQGDVSGEARQIIERASSPGDLIVLGVMLVICAPVFEEAFFRGLTMRAMQRRIGSTYAVLASALVFAVTHYQQLQFPGLFVFGVVAGLLTLRFGRIGPSVWAHAGFNLATVVVLAAGNLG